MKIILVAKCSECGWLRALAEPYFPEKRCYCPELDENSPRPVDDPDAIPEWCPLEASIATAQWARIKRKPQEWDASEYYEDEPEVKP